MFHREGFHHQISRTNTRAKNGGLSYQSSQNDPPTRGDIISCSGTALDIQPAILTLGLPVQEYSILDIHELAAANSQHCCSRARKDLFDWHHFTWTSEKTAPRSVRYLRLDEPQRLENVSVETWFSIRGMTSNSFPSARPQKKEQCLRRIRGSLVRECRKANGLLPSLTPSVRFLICC